MSIKVSFKPWWEVATMDSHEMTGNAEAGDMRNRIQQWLMEEGWQVGLGPSAPDALWTLTAQDERGRHMVVGQSANRKDQVIILNALKIAPEHQQRFNSLPLNQRNEVIFELRRATIQIDVLYMGLGEPLELIQFSQRIYYDGLTKDAFLQRVSRVRNAQILARNIIAQRLAEPPPPPETERHLGFPIPRTS